MPMEKTVLAAALALANAQAPTPALDAYADGFIKMLKAGKVSHLPGTILGSAPPTSELSGGSAQGGKILGLVPSTMASIAGAGNPLVAAALILEATAVSTYFMSAAFVSFTAGTIEGTSTETTVPAPGPLVGGRGAGTGLQITAIDGNSLAPLVAAATLATGPTQAAFYSALCDHVKQLAVVAYTAGTVTGTMTGSALVGGLGGGGQIS